KEVSFLAPCLVRLRVHPVSVVWMYALGRNINVREALGRIKSPDSVTLLGPIEKLPGSRGPGPGPGVAYPLRFCQIAFTPAQLFFGLFGFIDVNSDAVPLNDASLPVAQRLTKGAVPTKLAVCATETVQSPVRGFSLECVVEGPYGFWDVVRMNSFDPAGANDFAEPRSKIVEQTLVDVFDFA